jgi:hypothetical protein
MRIRRLYGATLASDFPFAAPFASPEGTASSPPDLTFSVCLEAPMPALWQQEHPIYKSPWRTEDGESAAFLYRAPGFEVMRFPGVLDFYLWPDRITCHLIDPGFQFLVELRLLGPVLAYWLEQRGCASIHASAVVLENRSAAFLSTHGGGKTGLAAALMRAGGKLLTDDLLPVEERDGTFWGHPGYPQMRMWPDEAAWFLGGCDDLPLVHPELTKRRVPVGPDGFGVFYDRLIPLACLYLPVRRLESRGPVEVHPVAPRDAVIELVRHSFSPFLVEAAGLQPGRFDLFARLARRVPVRRLSYPSGFDRLPDVAEAVLRDLEC